LWLEKRKKFNPQSRELFAWAFTNLQRQKRREERKVQMKKEQREPRKKGFPTTNNDQKKKKGPEWSQSRKPTKNPQEKKERGERGSQVGGEKSANLRGGKEMLFPFTKGSAVAPATITGGRKKRFLPSERKKKRKKTLPEKRTKTTD